VEGSAVTSVAEAGSAVRLLELGEACLAGAGPGDAEGSVVRAGNESAM
jgi:hypothetical protein